MMKKESMIMAQSENYDDQPSTCRYTENGSDSDLFEE